MTMVMALLRQGSVRLALLAGSVALVAALASWPARPPVRPLSRLRGPALRVVSLLGSLLAILAADPWLVWAGIAAALLALVPRAGMASAEGAGLLLALFGTMLHAQASAPEPHGPALALGLAPLAMACLGLGYAALAGLLPFVPAPLPARTTGAAICRDIAATAAVFALLRIASPGLGMILFGLLSAMLGGAGLWRARGMGQILASAGAVQAGLVVLAGGLGEAARPAGLVLLMLWLPSSVAGRLAAAHGSLRAQRAALLALAGAPPLGVFFGLVLLLRQALLLAPLAGLLAAACVALSATGLLTRRLAIPASAPSRNWPVWLLLLGSLCGLFGAWP